jgi:hypothetical protein
MRLVWENVVEEVSRNEQMWKAVLALKEIFVGMTGVEHRTDSCEYISVTIQGNPKGHYVIRGENNA